MEIAQALSWGCRQLDASPSPDLESRLLLQHAAGVDHAYLLAHADESLADEATERSFRELVGRAQRGEPLPYLIGWAPFRRLVVRVTPAVLIPRPETEQLVDLVLTYARTRTSPRMVDVGTGSGCIAVALATELGALVTAIDISADALAVARENAARYAADVRFLHGSLLEPVDEAIDVVIANLPYVTDDEWLALDDSVRLHEPALALRGGEDGLDLVRTLLAQAREKMRTPGALFLEIGWQQGDQAVAVAEQVFPDATIACRRDWAGRDRFVTIEIR